MLVLLLVASGGAMIPERSAEAHRAAHQVLGDLLAAPFPPASVLLGAAASNYSRHCVDHVRLYHSQLRSYAPWALNMYDSSAKLPSGVITGSTANLGHYEQCLQVVVKDEVMFTGQMCTAEVQFLLPAGSSPRLVPDSDDMLGLLSAVAIAAGQSDLSGLASVWYKWSFCVPSTCSAEDVQLFMDRSLAPLRLAGRLDVSTSASCLSPLSAAPQFVAIDYYFMSIMAIFALLVAAATVYDVFLAKMRNSKTEDSRMQMAARAFSVYTNGRALLSTAVSKNTMACINGIRFLSICWIIFGHTYYQTSISPLINALDVSHFRSRWAMMVVMNGTVSTDTFFVMSGALLCFVFMRDGDKGARFNLARFYLHRYIRLTPPYAAVLFFYASVMYHVGSGPLWDSVMAVERDHCLASWWTNLLYVNNYVNIASTCMSQSWYLTVDMQLFWATPLLLCPLRRWRRTGLAALCTALMVSVLVPLAVTARDHLAGAMLYTTGDSVTEVFIKVYLPAYTRAGPYLVGIALGYILYATKGKEVNIPKCAVCVGWTVAVSSMAAVVFGAFGMYQQQHRYSVVEASMYAGLHRTVWAICVAWIIFACVAGYGGPVDAFLSWGAWQPLSRLSYSAYLSHFVFLLVDTGLARTPAFTSGYNVLREMLGIMPLVLLTSAVISLVFEMPFVTLDKLFLSPSTAPYQKRAAVSPEAPSPAPAPAVAATSGCSITRCSSTSTSTSMDS